MIKSLDFRRGGACGVVRGHRCSGICLIIDGFPSPIVLENIYKYKRFSISLSIVAELLSLEL